MKKLGVVFGCMLGILNAQAQQNADSVSAKPIPRKVKNVILMIGDGTGLAQWSAAQSKVPQKLHVFSLAEYLGLSLTSSSNNYITDSGAGATALSIGEKTFNYAIGVKSDSTPSFTLSELLHVKGKSTGLVASCGLTHATPASFYAHQPSRKMEKEIANDFYSGFIDVAIGGDYSLFDSSKLQKAGYDKFICSATPLQNIESTKFIAFYDTAKHPKKFMDGRGPFLRDASLCAIKNLNKNKNGFFLMIEGSQIDWGGHENDFNYVVSETLDFDSTIATVVEWAKKDGETLVIITADHETGGLALNGYDKNTKQAIGAWTTKQHTGIPVPVFAVGPGGELFGGVYENNEIFHKIMSLFP